MKSDPKQSAPGPLIRPRPTEAKTVEKSITEKQQESIPDAAYWGASFTLPHSRFFMEAMEAQQDYKLRNWHYVPLQINEQHRQEYEGHKVMIHALCIQDKKCRRRLEKFLAKYTRQPIAWKKLSDEEPK